MDFDDYGIQPEITDTEEHIVQKLRPGTLDTATALIERDLSSIRESVVALRSMCIVDFLKALDDECFTLSAMDENADEGNCFTAIANPESPLYPSSSAATAIGADFRSALEKATQPIGIEAARSAIVRNIWDRIVDAREFVYEFSRRNALMRRESGSVPDVAHRSEILDALFTELEYCSSPQHIDFHSFLTPTIELLGQYLKPEERGAAEQLLRSIRFTRTGICVAFNDQLLEEYPTTFTPPKPGNSANPGAIAMRTSQRTLSTRTVLGFEFQGGTFEDEIACRIGLRDWNGT